MVHLFYVHQRVSIASLVPSGVATVADATAALAGHLVAGTDHLHEQLLLELVQRTGSCSVDLPAKHP